MKLINTVELETRERWLPFVQQVAANNGWDICGDDIESLVDQTAPYLADPSITIPEVAAQVLINYYQDAPLIQLLLYSNSHQSHRAWNDILRHCATTLHEVGAESEEQTPRVVQMQEQCREMLARHNYQTPLWMVLVALIQNAGIQYVKLHP